MHASISNGVTSLLEFFCLGSCALSATFVFVTSAPQTCSRRVMNANTTPSLELPVLALSLLFVPDSNSSLVPSLYKCV